MLETDLLLVLHHPSRDELVVVGVERTNTAKATE